jgi:transcriptional regulator with XRE-family HTH domain
MMAYTGKVTSAESLGRILQQARLLSGLSQRELARRLGTTQKYVWELEAGKPSIVMLTRLAQQSGLAGQDVIGLLRAYGRDVAGALRIWDPGIPGEPKQPALEPLSASGAAAMLEHVQDNPLGNKPAGGKTSLAGVQDKIVLARTGEGWNRVIDGWPSAHILKPASRDYPTSIYDEEYGSRFARAAGLTSFPTWIEEFTGVPAVVIERYDRSPDTPRDASTKRTSTRHSGRQATRNTRSTAARSASSGSLRCSPGGLLCSAGLEHGRRDAFHALDAGHEVSAAPSRGQEDHVVRAGRQVRADRGRDRVRVAWGSIAEHREPGDQQLVRADRFPGLRGVSGRHPGGHDPVRHFGAQGDHLRSVRRDNAGIRRRQRRCHHRGCHALQVIAHRGQRATEFPADGRRLLGVSGPETEHEPPRVGVGQHGRGTVCRLRRPGPDVGDAGAKRHPFGGLKQQGQLHQWILAADGLVDPCCRVPGALQPDGGLTLETDRRHPGERDRQVSADGPEGLPGLFDDAGRCHDDHPHRFWAAYRLIHATSADRARSSESSA